jgi:alpha-glucosidase
MGLPSRIMKTQRKKYSVVYMHDAQNLFDAKTSYAGEWNVDENWTVLMHN